MTYVSTNIFGSSLLQPQKQILHSGSNHFQRRKLHSRNRSPRRRRGSGNRSFPVRGRRLHNGSGLLRRLLKILPQRVGCPPGQPFPLSGIFGCTRHSQASLPLLSLARKFSLLIFRHTYAFIVYRLSATGSMPRGAVRLPVGRLSAGPLAGHPS